MATASPVGTRRRSPGSRRAPSDARRSRPASPGWAWTGSGSPPSSLSASISTVVIPRLEARAAPVFWCTENPLPAALLLIIRSDHPGLSDSTQVLGSGESSRNARSLFWPVHFSPVGVPGLAATRRGVLDQARLARLVSAHRSNPSPTRPLGGFGMMCPGCQQDNPLHANFCLAGDVPLRRTRESDPREILRVVAGSGATD